MEISKDTLKQSIESLLKLQEIDGELFQIKVKTETPSKEYLDVKSQLEEAQKVFKTVERAFRDVDRERRALELRTLTLTEDVKKSEAKKRELRNSKEEFAATREFEHFQKRIQENKKALEEKTTLTTQKSQAKDEKQKEVDALQARFDELHKAREAETKNLDQQMAELLTKRDQYISQVDEQIFTLYERVQKIRKGNGVAIVKGSVCSGCFVSLPPQTRHHLEDLSDLITCPSCSRILYPEAEAAHLHLKSTNSDTSGPKVAQIAS